MNQLILARAITGLAGGFNTLASIVLSDIIPLRKRGVWQAWRNLVFAAGMGAGSCGGWITDTIGWRWYVFPLLLSPVSQLPHLFALEVCGYVTFIEHHVCIMVMPSRKR